MAPRGIMRGVCKPVGSPNSAALLPYSVMSHTISLGSACLVGCSFLVENTSSSDLIREQVQEYSEVLLY